MTIRSDLGGGPAGVRALFEGGTAAARTDGQLLERFATGAGAEAERAFEALVGRHGTLVLRTCRGVLGHEDDARDAFQAVFLALARRGRGLWVRDSVGPWLHRVAVRESVRARRAAERRRAIERRAGLGADRAARGSAPFDLAAVVHEEVDRLPERYRVAVLLCDLEGRTVEQAARDLGCPVGTIKSRLSRARDQLRARLTRRGLAPGLLPLAPAGLAVPEVLARAAVGAACRSGVAASTGSVAAKLVAVARTHFTPTKAVLASLLGVGLVALGVEVAGRPGSTAPPGAATAPLLPPPDQAPAADPPPAPSASPPAPAEPLAWRRVDRYEPPDYFGFFGAVPAAGVDLLKVWRDEEGRDKRPAADVVPLVRWGLRSLDPGDQDEVLKWLGHRFIWGAATQDAGAIELMYHAADPRGPQHGHGELTALYYGLLRVQPTTPAILHSLADYCMAVDNTKDWMWVEHAARGHREELVGYLKPHLESPDPAVRERAAVVALALQADPGWAKAYGAWFAQGIRAKWGDRVPGLIRTLRDGTTRERIAALELIDAQRLAVLLDDEFVAAIRACAQDTDSMLRRQLAVVLGWARPDGEHPWDAAVVDIVLDLMRSDDADVRSTTVDYGIAAPLRAFRKEEIVRALAEVARRDRLPDRLQQIAWTLQGDEDLLIRVLDESLRGPDAAEAEATRAVYKALTGHDPPGGGPAAPAPAPPQATA